MYSIQFDRPNSPQYSREVFISIEIKLRTYLAIYKFLDTFWLN